MRSVFQINLPHFLKHIWGYSSVGRALGWHSRGQRFDPAYLHSEFTYKLFGELHIMFNMTTLRERSHFILWTLLVFFILSMSVGGLVGGANILDLVFKGKSSKQYVGWVGDTSITHQSFIRARDNQLAQLRRTGQTVDSRAYQNASNFAWNTLVERILKDEKIKDLGLEVQSDEIYDFLLLTPPPAFQNNLIEQGLFTNVDNKFDLEAFQTAVKNGGLPEQLNPLLAQWENYLRTWLADRKLQNLYNATGTVSNFEVKMEYSKQNVNCTLDYIFVNTNSIADSLITIGDNVLLAKYNKDKETYTTPEKRVVEYVFWEIPADIKLDTLNNTIYSDSLLQDALLFVDEADLTSFTEAITITERDSTKTAEVHEGFSNNSGLPFPWGTVRSAIRFAFDNPIGTVSDPINVDNGIVVFHITGSIDEDYRQFEDVKSSIKRSLIREEKKSFAKTYLSENSADNTDWKSLADSDDFIEFVEADTKTIGGTFTTIGKSGELTGTLLAMEAGDLSPVLTTFNTACIVKMISKDEFDDTAYDEAFVDLKTQLNNTKSSRGYSNWLKAAKDNIEVIDNRASFY